MTRPSLRLPFRIPLEPDSPLSDPILAICSVDAEARPLLDLLEHVRSLDVPGVAGWLGEAGGLPVWCVQAGMGKVNAAHSATVALRAGPFAGVIGFGIGGAYPGSGLAVGDLAVATAEEYGDEGSLTPDGWISCEGIGIPLVNRNGRQLYNRFDCDAELTEIASRAAAQSATARSGTFLTLSCCSGTDESAARMERRFGAICETMEGAAYAHIAALYDVPFVEIRGISNLVGNRNPAAWRVSAAAEASAVAVTALLHGWPTSRTEQ